MNTRRITRLTLTDRRGALKRPVTFAVCADLHDAPFDDLLPALREADAILVPGDLVNRHHRSQPEAERFLEAAPDIAPVFYSLGNHEIRAEGAEAFLEAARRSRVTLLEDAVVRFREDLWIGGLSSRWQDDPIPLAAEELARQEGFRLLLCHHPEHFAPFVQGRPIDLTVAGHAHGGQIQLFGRGLYAPGQGIFPRLTHGFYSDRHLLVSRGLTNSSRPRLPRWGNPCELILLTLQPSA